MSKVSTPSWSTLYLWSFFSSFAFQPVFLLPIVTLFMYCEALLVGLNVGLGSRKKIRGIIEAVIRAVRFRFVGGIMIGSLIFNVVT